jgi:hypothetical protein
MFIPAKSSTLSLLRQLSADTGLNFVAAASRPSVDVIKLHPVRIGLWDTYGGSVTSGWTRWLLEQYEFPFQVVFAKTLDAGDLASRFDVLIFPDDAIPIRDSLGGQPNAASIPAGFRDSLGRVTIARTVPELKKFVESGGTLLAIGSSTSIRYQLGLPIRNALVERSATTGVETPLRSENFYVPGAIVEARVDTTNPLAYGLESRVDVFFDNSPAFRLLPDAGQKGSNRWRGSTLRGRCGADGPEIVWRAQPHGTFKFLFNGYLSWVGALTARGRL